MPSPKIPVECPECHEVRMLRPSDAKKAKVCKGCHNRRIAPLGYAATVEKHGEDFALKAVQTYRLENPSDLEQIVMDRLDAWGVEYQREGWVVGYQGQTLLVDFMLPNKRVIEVNGYWHTQRVDTQARDEYKRNELERLGYRVLHLSETQVRNRLEADLKPFVKS